MDFELSEEQKFIQNIAKKFREKELKDIIPELDKNQEFPLKLIKKLSEPGLLGMIVPEDYGGGGLDILSLITVIEEISKGSPSLGLILAIQNLLVAYPIHKFGNKSQKGFLSKISSGEKLGCFVGNGIETVLEGNQFILNGKAGFIPNAEKADIFLVIIKEGKERKVILIEKGEGLSIKKREDLMGLRYAGIGDIYFNGYRTSKENILEGGEIYSICQALERIGLASISLGIAQIALESSIEYSKERVQFGRPISEFEMVQDMLVSMALNISIARLLTYYAASLVGKDEFIYRAAMAKLFSCDMVVDITNKAIQVYGGYGYTKEYPVERFFRDALTIKALGGTQDSQRELIMKGLRKGRLKPGF